MKIGQIFKFQESSKVWITFSTEVFRDLALQAGDAIMGNLFAR